MGASSLEIASGESSAVPGSTPLSSVAFSTESRTATSEGLRLAEEKVVEHDQITVAAVAHIELLVEARVGRCTRAIKQVPRPVLGC
jgi:hypothetical protein